MRRVGWGDSFQGGPKRPWSHRDVPVGGAARESKDDPGRKERPAWRECRTNLRDAALTERCARTLSDLRFGCIERLGRSVEVRRDASCAGKTHGTQRPAGRTRSVRAGTADHDFPRRGGAEWQVGKLSDAPWCPVQLASPMRCERLSKYASRSTIWCAMRATSSSKNALARARTGKPKPVVSTNHSAAATARPA